MQGASAASTAAETTDSGPFKDPNYERLLDDLIVDESQAWMMNRYEQGTVRPGKITRDAQGRPSDVDADYSYMGMGRKLRGKVRVTFRDGMPECLYFSDMPTACRAASPRVISAYRHHQYAD